MVEREGKKVGNSYFYLLCSLNYFIIYFIKRFCRRFGICGFDRIYSGKEEGEEYRGKEG